MAPGTCSVHAPVIISPPFYSSRTSAGQIAIIFTLSCHGAFLHRDRSAIDCSVLRCTVLGGFYSVLGETSVLGARR